MPDHEKSLSYLERSIKAAAFATKRGQELIEFDGYWGDRNKSHRNRLYRYCIRRSSKKNRTEWKRLAENLKSCGEESVEKRAAELLKLLNAWSLFSIAVIALLLVGLAAAIYFAVQSFS